MKAHPQSDAQTLSPEVYAQLMYAIENEMTVKPVDFFIRRTGSLYFNIQWVRKWKEPVINYMGELFNWDDETKRQYAEELEQAINEAAPKLVNS